MQRPISLSIVGWFLIVSAAFSLISVLMLPTNPIAVKMMEQSSLPLSAHMAIGAIGSIVIMASGYGVLKGFNWSRFLYVGWSILGFAISLATVPIMSVMLLGLIFVAVISFVLLRAAANAWFGRGAAATGE